MKKLKLELEDLTVASFATAPAAEAQGTVEAHIATPLCVVTAGINSCWCSEYHTCDCI